MYLFYDKELRDRTTRRAVGAVEHKLDSVGGRVGGHGDVSGDNSIGDGRPSGDVFRNDKEPANSGGSTCEARVKSLK
jgi:hypothetical protein